MKNTLLLQILFLSFFAAPSQAANENRIATLECDHFASCEKCVSYEMSAQAKVENSGSFDVDSLEHDYSGTFSESGHSEIVQSCATKQETL